MDCGRGARPTTQAVGRRTLERYDELLRCHVLPTRGTRPLQQLQPTEIDALYQALEGKVSPRTAHHVHVVIGACLATAVRKGLLTNSPLARAEKVPSPGEGDHGMALDEGELRTLLGGFRESVLSPSLRSLPSRARAATKSWRCAGPIWTP